ncbi:hypothetical protein E05_21940 [Plautia stali symbiont]|nr:hypothetical protein E05_21940 [Plautia stali symbiont]
MYRLLLPHRFLLHDRFHRRVRSPLPPAISRYARPRLPYWLSDRLAVYCALHLASE